VVLFFCLFCCLHSRYFTLVEATEREWVAGRQSAGKGKEYRIKLIVRKDYDKLSFHKLWVNNRPLDLRTGVNSNAENREFQKGDTLILSARSVDSDNKTRGIEKQLPLNVTEKYKEAEAVLHYRLKDKDRYYPVDEFNELDARYLK